MIIVTGASGQLGHAIVERLAHRVSPEQIGASVRDPAKAEDLAALGVRVRRGDFADPSTLAHAFEGATQVLIVSSNAAAYGGDTLAQHRAAIAAARAAGARRVLYTSHMGANERSHFAPMRDHAATERMLRDAGLPWTALRNGYYASSAFVFLGDALQSGALEAPRDGGVSWTAHADLAEAAAVVLADEGRFEGPTPPLTGSQALDLGALTAIASELLGREVRRTFVTDDEQRARMLARGVPAHVVAILLGFYRASREGEFAAVDPTLASLLRRPLATMRDVLAAKLDTPR